MSYKLIPIFENMDLYRKILKKFVDRFDVCSGEVSFLDIYGDKQSQTYIFGIDDCYCILMFNPSYEVVYSYVSPIAFDNDKNKEKELIKTLRKIGVLFVYSEKVFNTYFTKDEVKLFPLTWSDDPVISIKNTIELKGGDYKKLRNIRNKYDRYVEEGKIIVKELKEIDKVTSEKMINVIQSWRNNSKSFESQNEIYNTPENYVKEFNTINNNRDFMCLCIYDANDNLLCYEMTELIFDKFVNSCVGYKNYDIETDLDVDGLNEYIMLTSVLYWFRRLKRLGLNVDDMALGMAGEHGDKLRSQKMKYRPYKINRLYSFSGNRGLKPNTVMKKIENMLNDSVNTKNSLY